MTTQPSVSTEIAPDEQEMFDTSSGGFGGDETGAMSDPEGGFGSDDEYDDYANAYSALGSQLEVASSVPAVPSQGLGALSLSGISETQAASKPFG